jgi:DNA-binding response OmpR family regulator
VRVLASILVGQSSQDLLLSPPGPARVLFVPDDLLTGELRDSFLDRTGIQARTADGPATALAMAELWRPSVVVFRSDLSGVRVSEFCERMRAAELDRPAKLVMLTEHFGDIDDALDASCDSHLISPVETHQLLDTIATLLDVAQRRTPRALLETLVQTKGFSDLEGANDPTLGNSINVSEDGMLLESNRQLKLHTEGQLQFFLPSAGARLSLKGVVQLAVDEVRLHYAIQFKDVAPADRNLLRRFVEQSDLP